MIQNLNNPVGEVSEQNTTLRSKQAMLTELELLFQQQVLNIRSHVGQLPAQLANYRVLDSPITQDSVMALGFAVTHRHRAHDTPSRWPEPEKSSSTPSPSWMLDLPERPCGGAIASARCGWSWALSDLKTLLETGGPARALDGSAREPAARPRPNTVERIPPPTRPPTCPADS